MALSAAVSPINQSKMAQGQFIADLAGLLQRFGVVTGENWDEGLLESLLSSSDNFRGRLFTLCTAISHMSEQDLSGDELLSLLGRALGLAPGAALPAGLRSLFLSGLDAWNTRSLAQQDEWPPVKKPAASVSVMPAAETGTARSPGARMQEAIGLARTRGLDQHTQPEPHVDVNSLAIDELNALLGEIEDRMKRLRPHVVAPEPGPAEVLSPAAREAAFLERHSYMQRKRPPTACAPIIDQLAITVPEPEPAQPAASLAALAPVEPKPLAARLNDPDDELHLVPRGVPVEDESEDDLAGRLRVVIPDALRLKTYLALALVICVALVGTPISVVVAYRYMHPLYVYDPAPKVDPPPTAPPANAAAPQAPTPVTKGKADHAARRAKQAQQKPAPPVQVFPAQ